MKHLLKKHRMLSVGIFLAAVLSIIYAAILSPAGKSTGSFSEFCTTLFREEMKSNTMNLHFTLKDPKLPALTLMRSRLAVCPVTVLITRPDSSKNFRKNSKNILTALSKEKTA